MIICGIKLTHDGAIALIDNGVLKFSIEIEKINNNKRYSDIQDVSIIPKILEVNGYNMEMIDRFVIDGWHGSGNHWNGPSILKIQNNNHSIALDVAPYNENGIKENILTRFFYNKLLYIDNSSYNYSSYMHVAGHIMSTYCTSPFAKKNQSSFILTWDGGQYPRLYYFNSKIKIVENLGHLFLFIGTIYSVFAQYFGPYKKTSVELMEDKKKSEIEGFFGGYSVAGKIMSYIALGKVKRELLILFEKLRKESLNISIDFVHTFSKKVRQIIQPEIYRDEDVLATFHVYLENLLLEKLKEKIAKYPLKDRNFCFSGGCALNIKWNSAIRNSGLFKEVYVPPFPNDSGSAIGVACCEYFNSTKESKITWNVYSGPLIGKSNQCLGWTESKCSIQELANHLYISEEPVVFLNGAAELGPRALGNRSIIASPNSLQMKNILNKVKNREEFRPVAPICLEEDAPFIFNPGCKDSYMLFDHKVREDWLARIPAVCHLDRTARLQTISQDDNKIVFLLLSEYKKLSGLPLLCNTSANLNGSGFFPDIKSAMQWGALNYIWSDNVLYSKEVKNDLYSL